MGSLTPSLVHVTTVAGPPEERQVRERVEKETERLAMFGVPEEREKEST